MTKLTDYTVLEQKVFDATVELHDHEIDYGPTLEELMDVLDIELNSLKGVLGSLIKKSAITLHKGDFEIPDCYTANF